MKLNHILIGAGRSGTTTLTDYLRQHPQILFSSIKEVTYFSEYDKYQRGVSFLDSFFSKATSQPIKATSDTYLLMSKDAPKRLFDYNPKIKLAVILREPISRTFSAYKYAINSGYVSNNISLLDIHSNEKELLENGNIVDQNNYAIFDGSLYYKHISYWLQTFSKNQLFICTTNDLAERPQHLLNQYSSFLGIDSITIKEELKSNVSSTYKNKHLNEMLMNRKHPVRKIAKRLLKLGPIRKIVINNRLIEKIKSTNTKFSSDEIALSQHEVRYCEEFFKEDLELLRQNFGVTFDEYA